MQNDSMNTWGMSIGGEGNFSLAGNTSISMAIRGLNQRWLRICTNASKQNSCTSTIWGGRRGSAAAFKGKISSDRNTVIGRWKRPGGGYNVAAGARPYRWAGGGAPFRRGRRGRATKRGTPAESNAAGA